MNGSTEIANAIYYLASNVIWAAAIIYVGLIVNAWIRR